MSSSRCLQVCAAIHPSACPSHLPLCACSRHRGLQLRPQLSSSHRDHPTARTVRHRHADLARPNQPLAACHVAHYHPVSGIDCDRSCGAHLRPAPRSRHPRTPARTKAPVLSPAAVRPHPRQLTPDREYEPDLAGCGLCLEASPARPPGKRENYPVAPVAALVEPPVAPVPPGVAPVAALPMAPVPAPELAPVWAPCPRDPCHRCQLRPPSSEAPLVSSAYAVPHPGAPVAGTHH